MLKIDPVAFAAATEALMVAARSVEDSSGLVVLSDTPHTDHTIVSRQGVPDNADWPRIRAITLGAIVALVNGAAYPGDEVHL